LICTGATSRAVMGMVMCALRPARADGVSVHVGRPRPATAALGIGLAAALGFALLPLWAALVVIGISAVFAAAVARLAQVKIGGQTGDVLGAVQQISEIAGLLAISALL
ncbi:MAG: adenosylcobinamide-GDP ribazoletransferase, partial [Mangrovicoccus sp.]|nr:adenosylcobinamide-GDP ribazoletransferase [Mangrovicoccus sp.]